MHLVLQIFVDPYINQYQIGIYNCAITRSTLGEKLKNLITPTSSFSSPSSALETVVLLPTQRASM